MTDSDEAQVDEGRSLTPEETARLNEAFLRAMQADPDPEKTKAAADAVVDYLRAEMKEGDAISAALCAVLPSMRDRTARQWREEKQYAIYNSPLDYPGKFVVRGHTLTHPRPTPDPEPTAVVDTLEEARAAIPSIAERTYFPRFADDVSSLLEVWW